MIKTKANVIKVLFIVLLSLLMMTGGIVFLCGEVSTPPAQMEEQVDEVKAASNNNYVHWTSYGANGQIGSNFGGYVWSGYEGAQNYRGGFGKSSTQSTGTDSISLTRIAGESNRGIVFNTSVTNYKTGLRAGHVRISSGGSQYKYVSMDSLSGTSAERGAINYKSDLTWDVYLYYVINYKINWTLYPDNYNGYHYDENSFEYRYDTASSSGKWWWSVDGETKTGTPVVPTRTGFIFKGFRTAKDGGGSLILNASMNWSNTWNASTAYYTPLYDHWVGNTYIVTANANGGTIPSTSGWTGSGSTSTKSVTYKSTYGTLPTPTRTGYTFAGWYTESNSGSGAQIQSGTIVDKAYSHTIYAHWTANNYNLKIDPASGSYNNSTGLTSITQGCNSTYTYLTPTKTGYNFDGWHAGREYLSSATAFNGSSNYVPVGRSPMYTDGISVAVRAGMASWSEFKTSDMRLVSCTEAGGWNFEPSGEYVQFACYDSGVGYKSAKASIKWSDLATGYHTFTGTFDGEYARVYIDGKLYGTSAKFTSGKIGYHASNGIFIGAEAGSNATTPAGNYFKGTIDYVAISSSGAVSKPATFTFPAYNSASTAQWTAKTFTLTFDGNGGGTPSPTSKTITYDSTYGTLASVSRTGHTFNGWRTSASGGSRITESTKVTVTANQTVYAHWTANQYTITANANSGINAAKTGWTLASDSKTSTMIFTYGQAASEMPIASRTGYTFNGWYTAASGGTKVANANGSFIASVSGYTDANKNWIGTSDTTLYAHWAINKYTLKIDPNGGIYNSTTSTSTFSQNYYTTKAISNPTRAGYTFAGWVATKEINGATWAQILYHFNDLGSQLFASSDNLSTQTKNDFYRNSQFANLARYNLTSYEFLLQYSHISGYNQWKQTSNPATTYNTISGYQAVSISWTDNAWGGIAKSSTTASTFIDGSPGTGTWFYALGSYVAWNGGIPGPSAAEKQVTRLWLKTDSTLSNLKPTASFHNDDALGSTNYYYFKDEDITLKALWIINSYTLTANANSGSIPSTTGWTGTGTTATKSVVYDTAYGTLPVPTRTGYGFDGWYTAESGGTKVSASTKMGAANATIYAHWTINKYTLTVDANGGSFFGYDEESWTKNGSIIYRTVEYGTSVFPLGIAATRQGYVLDGYYTQRTGGVEITEDNNTISDNLTIYAHWQDTWVKYMSEDNPVMDQTDGYYKIDSAAKLARLAYLVNYNIDNGKWASYKYKQTADIDLSAHYWQPIGWMTAMQQTQQEGVFNGTFDGTTFDINGLKLYNKNNIADSGQNDKQYVGLFGLLGMSNAATYVRNVNLYNIDAGGIEFVGGIAGRAENVRIENCVVTGKVETNDGKAGGIVGEANETIFIGCTNYALVSGNGWYLGGIVGHGTTNTTIDSCINYGNVKNFEGAEGFVLFKGIGGIIGDVQGNFTVTNCVNHGAITSICTTNYDCVGGIVGSSYTENSTSKSSILNCQNFGRLEGKFNIGGIAGCNSLAAIKYCLNIGDVNITSNYNDVGTSGIVGIAYNTGVIESCFVSCTLTTPNGARGKVGAIIGRYAGNILEPVIKYCGAKITVVGNPSDYGAFVGADEHAVDALENSYSLMMYGSTKINRITATTGGMDDKFGMVSSIHDGLPVPLGIYHVSQYGTTTGIASTLTGSKYGCTTA